MQSSQPFDSYQERAWPPARDPSHLTPDTATANGAFIRKTIAAQSLLLAVEKALEAVGGGGIFRAMGLERHVRDIHAAQFHPLQAKRQCRFTGRAALGLDPAG